MDSVLQRISGPLCDSVTARTGSQRPASSGGTSRAFLIAADEVSGCGSLPRLFADLLRATLEQQSDATTQRPQRRAAWYADHGLADDAHRHAGSDGEMTAAG